MIGMYVLLAFEAGFVCGQRALRMVVQDRLYQRVSVDRSDTHVCVIIVVGARYARMLCAASGCQGQQFTCVMLLFSL